VPATGKAVAFRDMAWHRSGAVRVEGWDSWNVGGRVRQPVGREAVRGDQGWGLLHRSELRVRWGASSLAGKVRKESSMCSLNRRVGLLGLLALVGILLFNSLPPVAQEKPPAGQGKRTDQYGDPLPRGALARIGTVRFRTGNSVMAVRFSPDGKTLASVGHDAVVLWDPRNGKELRRLEIQPTFYRGNYSPDGRKLWLQTYEGAISVWDLSARPDPGPVPFQGQHTGFVQPFPDGKRLAAGHKNAIHIWDIAAGKVVRELPHDAEVSEVALSADGKLLAAHGSRAIWLWDTRTGKKLRSFPPQLKKDQFGRTRDEDRVNGFAMSRDGKRLATSVGRFRPVIRLWDVPTGKEAGLIAVKDITERKLVYSPDGKLLARACQNSLSLWDVTNRQELWQTPVWGNQPFDIAFSPDGRTLAAGLVCMVRLWDVATGRELCPIPEHRGGVGFVWLSPDGRTVITEGQMSGGVPGSSGPGPDAPSLRYWDAGTGRQLVGGEQRFPPLADLSADGKTLAGWGKEKTVELIRVATGKAIASIPYEDEVWCCNLAPDGKVLLLGTRNGKARVSTTDTDVKLQLWDVQTGKALSLLTGHKGMLWGGGTFSPDGKQLATIGYKDETVRVWDVASGREVYQFKTPGGLLVFSADGRTLVSAALALPIRRWDLATGKELPVPNSKLMQEKHAAGVYALGLLPDGKTLITTDNFGKVYFWETVAGKLRLELPAHHFRVSLLAVSSDGAILLTRGASTALVWDLDSLLGKRQ
jgi:WD40 repeat protein